MAWTEEEMLAIPWYHPNLTRPEADSLLLQNGTEGCFLLRRSDKPDHPFSLSFKCQDAVKHVTVDRLETGAYKFGYKEFTKSTELREHLEAGHPVLGLGSGVMITLLSPYPREIRSFGGYNKITFGRLSQNCDEQPPSAGPLPAFSTATQEGLLWKRGAFNTDWKERWFKLHKFSLAYYKYRPTETDPRKPKAVIDLRKVLAVEKKEGASGPKDAGEPFVFTLTTPSRVYVMNAATKETRDMWIDCIKHKITEATMQHPQRPQDSHDDMGGSTRSLSVATSAAPSAAGEAAEGEEKESSDEEKT